MFSINTEELRNRLKTAYDMASHGAIYKAFEFLCCGDNEEEFYIRTQTPIIQNSNFQHLLDDADLTCFDSEDFEKGQHVRYNFRNLDCLTIDIDTEEKNPVCHIIVSGRTLNAYVGIKQTDDGLFQIDEAFIGVPGNTLSADIYDLGHKYDLPIEKGEDGEELLRQFLTAFSEASKLIISDRDDLTPQEIEADIFKSLKPIIDKVNEIEARMVAKYEEWAATAGSTPPTPSA